MQHDRKQLLQLAQNQPWYMFTGEEIAALCNVSQNVISGVKRLNDSPFFLNKCRPEWFVEWMREHTEFQLTKAAAPKLAISDKPTGNIRRTRSPKARPKIIRRRKPRSKRSAAQKR